MEKIATAQKCLETSFAHVRGERMSEHYRFVLLDGGTSSELLFARAFLDHIRPEQLAWFREHMTSQIIPLVKANAGKKIFVSDSGVDISESDPP